MGDEETTPSAPPPSYDDVIAAGSSVIVSPSPLPPVDPTQPSYPPSSVRQANTTSHVTSPPARQYHRSSLQQMVGQQGHTSTVSPPGRPQHRRKPNFLDKIAIFNMPNIMLIGLTLPRINPELDSEAHLPNRSSFEKRAARRKRLKCICGWLWCCGFTLLFILIALPVAMLLAGIFGISSCPFNNQIIILSMLCIGSLFITTLIFRLLNSGLSCCKLTNVCNTERSLQCSACIAIMEGLFVFTLILTALTVLFCTWLMFQEIPNFTSISSHQYCDRGVYYSAIGMIIVLYLISFCVAVYMGVAGFCYYSYRRELNPSRRRRQIQQQQQQQQRRHHAQSF